ncbi:uncharacterized protein EI90DRAFT_1293277 [Cantharellus anzutake]|uniref:uncharacterized protein n=1 Tax=Cantharellus anzutake TaxID=1750568 RepID=UPI001906A615|nr:uncharacterized protein EI90DRAFT_1293277 [Cantharellus anzutake]KAF8342001.1 hypothetical protein EI90DRAFT_1293277 [Cantharellus anzutake]
MPTDGNAFSAVYPMHSSMSSKYAERQNAFSAVYSMPLCLYASMPLCPYAPMHSSMSPKYADRFSAVYSMPMPPYAPIPSCLPNMPTDKNAFSAVSYVPLFLNMPANRNAFPAVSSLSLSPPAFPLPRDHPVPKYAPYQSAVCRMPLCQAMPRQICVTSERCIMRCACSWIPNAERHALRRNMHHIRVLYVVRSIA